MKNSRYKIARYILVFWTLFIGIGAVAGAFGMLTDPSGKAMGMDAMLPYFQKLPLANILFRDLTFSGWALLIVNGITNLLAAALLIANQKLGIVLGGVFGITLMLWICIQFYMFPPNFMSTIYFVFGFCQAITGYCAYVFKRQEAFSFNPDDYKNIGTNTSKLVVYFSRMGYVKKIAYETANRLGSDILEIKAAEKINGTLGFLWCGRYGIHKWSMGIENASVNLSGYDEVTVCSPIWVFSLAAPIRSFLNGATGKIHSVNYIFVHHTNGKYEKVANDADSLLGIKHTSLINIRCRMGKFKVL